MVVQHNLTAMNSNRMLGITTSAQAKSTEKLSSGYKINRAADDAAGLSISEKMRKQIRGLSQASLNAQDGISAVQTAEGALNEVQDMLQRMNELAVKASNGTMSESDRSYVQNEVDQLVTEIDRVAETTKFNETYLLKGNGKGVGTGTEIKPSFVEGTTNVEAVINPTQTTAVKEKFTSGALTQSGTAGGKAATVTVEYVDKNGELKSKDVEFKSATAAAGSASNLIAAINADSDLNSLFAVSGANTGIIFEAKTEGTEQGRVMGITVKTAGADTVAIAAGGTRVAGVDAENTYNISGIIDSTGDKVTIGDKTYTKAAAINADEREFTTFAELQEMAKNDGYLVGGTSTAATFKKQETILELKLHVGADSTSNNQIKVNISSMDAASLGLKNGKTTVDGEEF